MNRKIIKLIVPICIVVGWELIAMSIDNPWKLPQLVKILSIVTHPNNSLLGTGTLIENTYYSLKRVVLGFGLACLIAIPLGVGMGWSKYLGDLFDYIVEVLRPIPPLAWIPLIMAWLGLGLRSAVMIIFLGAFFPILVNTIEGVKSISKSHIEVAKTFDASDYDIMRKIVIPHSSPYIVTGLRIGMGIAWMCLVAAEMMPGIAPSGLGYLIWQANTVGQISIIISGIIYIGIIGLLIDRSFKLIEKRYFSWREIKQ
ncbi:MAG TPA: ABC transporter permease [Candidatus Methanofastidiosa archaeon]|nr:ABC transporter permease [Candidatus Methanofastidiosa archaeon]